MSSYLKEENVLVLLKHQDPFIEYAIFESCVSCCFLVWAQNFSTIPRIVNFPIQAMIHLRIKSLWLSFKHWSGSVKYCFNYVRIT